MNQHICHDMKHLNKRENEILQHNCNEFSNQLAGRTGGGK